MMGLGFLSSLPLVLLTIASVLCTCYLVSISSFIANSKCVPTMQQSHTRYIQERVHVHTLLEWNVVWVWRCGTSHREWSRVKTALSYVHKLSISARPSYWLFVSIYMYMYMYYPWHCGQLILTTGQLLVAYICMYMHTLYMYMSMCAKTCVCVYTLYMYVCVCVCTCV